MSIVDFIMALLLNLVAGWAWMAVNYPTNCKYRLSSKSFFSRVTWNRRVHGLPRLWCRLAPHANKSNKSPSRAWNLQACRCPPLASMSMPGLFAHRLFHKSQLSLMCFSGTFGMLYWMPSNCEPNCCCDFFLWVLKSLNQLISSESELEELLDQVLVRLTSRARTVESRSFLEAYTFSQTAQRERERRTSVDTRTAGHFTWKIYLHFACSKSAENRTLDPNTIAWKIVVEMSRIEAAIQKGCPIHLSSGQASLRTRMHHHDCMHS